MAGLSLKSGQVTGWLGRGSGIVVTPEAPVAAPPELQAASNGPSPPASSPAPALCLRKLRRDSPGRRVPSSDQPSLGCIVRSPLLGRPSRVVHPGAATAD